MNLRFFYDSEQCETIFVMMRSITAFELAIVQNSAAV